MLLGQTLVCPVKAYSDQSQKQFCLHIAAIFLWLDSELKNSMSRGDTILQVTGFYFKCCFLKCKKVFYTNLNAYTFLHHPKPGNTSCRLTWSTEFHIYLSSIKILQIQQFKRYTWSQRIFTFLQKAFKWKIWTVTPPPHTVKFYSQLKGEV